MNEYEGHFTSHSEAVEYLREMGQVRHGKPMAGCWRYDLVADDVVERWAVVVGPARVPQVGAEEAEQKGPSASFFIRNY